MKAEDMLELPRSLWAKVGGKAATKIVNDSDKGFGTNENTGKRYKFPSYTSKYAAKKQWGKPDRRVSAHPNKPIHLI